MLTQVADHIHILTLRVFVAGLYVQVLRGDHDRPAPQGHHARPQGQLDVQTRHEAQGAPRPHRRRQAIQRYVVC